MARKKLLEFRAKTDLAQALSMPYLGCRVDTRLDIPSQIDPLPEGAYVVKVDAGIKKRMKNGLVALNIQKADLPKAITELSQKGYFNFLVEPFITHSPEEERYISLSRLREGIQLLYSSKGGIEIEDNQDAIEKVMMTEDTDVPQLAQSLSLPSDFLKNILQAFEDNHFVFLEINPLVIHEGHAFILDAACEVDDTAELLVHNAWSGDDFPKDHTKTEEEQNIEILKTKSSSSFSFTPINLDGGIWMLLSGGGVSIVLADEVYNLGYGKELANYGEYSGNPNAEETYIYTKNVLSLLLKSHAPKKIILIGGGVANFTDITKTFTGVIHALDEVKDELQHQGVKVFVRRGGPNQKEGLQRMKDFLEKGNLFGAVYGPEVPLPQIVSEMVEAL